jgi:hypothetical protein
LTIERCGSRLFHPSVIAWSPLKRAKQIHVQWDMGDGVDLDAAFQGCVLTDEALWKGSVSCWLQPWAADHPLSISGSDLPMVLLMFRAAASAC